ncbi:MAG: hypothetical protein JWR19_1683 [Pedosphaera sp.]|nr:hypothetical protein [Pedosphaera sp.]
MDVETSKTNDMPTMIAEPTHMKSLKSKLSLLAAAIAMLLAFAGSVSAQLVAYDDASNYHTNGVGGNVGNWTNGVNPGFGFTSWTIVTNNSGPGPSQFHGNYVNTGFLNPRYVIASVTNISGVTYTNVWGLFANGTNGINETTAFRGFASPLGTNTFKLQWGSKGAGVTTIPGTGAVHGWCGFTLRNGNATNSASDFQTGVRFYLYFLDGAAPSTLYVWDGNGVQSLAGTGFGNLGRTTITNAVEAEVTVGADGNSYHLLLKDSVQNKTLYTLDSTLMGAGTIDSAALFCHETTADQVYNRMQIAIPSLVPPTIVNIQPTNGSIYLPTATPLTFEVDSFNSTVASNFVSVFLNGVLQSGSIFNTTTATNQLLGTNNAVLSPNTFYNYAVVAQDANGNITSNSVTFNTFSSSNLSIDAMDYNYGAGQFIPNPGPAQYGGLLGTNGIDYLDVTTLTNFNDYRPDYTLGDPPLPQLITIAPDATGDPVDHEGFIAGSIVDYQTAFTDAGDWANYTRTFPTTNYTVYARAASAGGGAFEVDQLANPTATTAIQPLAALGTCTIPATGGSKVYSGQLVPLVDMFGNTVVLHLSGTTTLRQTSTQVRTYNLSYLTFVPNSSTSLLKPYISLGSPAPAAGSVVLDSKISFTIANRQTAVNPATITLSLNGTDVTGSLALSNNAAGTVVTYSPSVFLTPNTTNTLTSVFKDNTGTNSVTNTWSFTTVNQTLTTLTNVLTTSPGTAVGFGLSLYKIDNTGPEPSTIVNALLQLNGQVTNGATVLPWTNTINGLFTAASTNETNTLNYDTTGAATGSFTFTNKSAFPLIPTVGSQFNFVMQSLFYLRLTNGSYHIVVRSDDGFNLTAGPTPTNTTQTLGQFNGGRANTTPTDLFINVPTTGWYPMNLLYFQESGGGSLEFYSVSNGTTNLVNDASNPNSLTALQFVVVAAPLPAPTIGNITVNGGQVVISGTNNLGAGGTYHLLTSTNLLLPLASWTVITNDSFDGNGNFSSTNSAVTNNQQFFIIQVP